MRPWWHLREEEVIEALTTSSSAGLTGGEAARRLEQYGPNQLKEQKRHGPLAIFFEQFKDFIILVLAGAAIVSGFLQEWVDALAILAIVVINAILGFIQEYRAEKSLAALRKLSAPTAKAVRDGKPRVLQAAELVPGDVIELEAGDNVPADARLIDVTPNFATLEASLTGESQPTVKTDVALDEKDVPLADRANMVYMGTSVSSGKARAVVVMTGMETELGKIAGMIQGIAREMTPLQRKLEEFGKWIVYLAFFLVALVFGIGLLRGGSLLELFLTSVSLAVAAIPEGLPAVVTIALALGVQRMVRRHALIRKLPSVETLGAATVICSDKTGTLTKNEMTVRAVFASGRLFEVTGIGYAPVGGFRGDSAEVDVAKHPTLLTVLRASVLCNGARLMQEKEAWRIYGDPTEGALLTMAAKAGMLREPLEGEYPFVEEIPFDSERKTMTIIRRGKTGMTAYVKGAPDVMLDACTQIETDGQVRQLTAEDKARVLEANAALAGRALRVLAVGYRALESLPPKCDAATVERSLTFAGLVAMIDPPREEVKRAVALNKSAGIRTVMITGDHKSTAVAIARDLGFYAEGDRALSGEELDTLSDEELRREVEHIPVYARVSPEHKLRIVRAWRSRGEIVAMTGDGVNDAPAVKEADIGVAMGITGTDVTKEVADMIVTDDNFASIVAAVEEGRGIYDNIRKFIHYLLSCNTGEIFVMFIASLVGLPVPLLPIQILWVNLVTDGLPALALGVDPVAPDVMRRPPRPAHEPVVTRERTLLILLQGGFIAVCSLTAFLIALYVEHEDIVRARTMAFIVLAGAQLFHAFNCRSQRVSIFRLGLFTNKKLVLAAVVSFLLLAAVVYVPFLQLVFRVEPLSGIDWALVVVLSSLPLWAMELVKLFRSRSDKK